MGRYTDAHFQRDIKQLESLINGFSGSAAKQMGGKVVTAKSGLRSFRVVKINGKAQSTGRYTLKKGQDVRMAASRALIQACRKMGLKGDACKLKLALQETTRGSGHKVYEYHGKRVRLSKPRKVTRGGKTYTATHETVIRRVGGEHKGGWKFYN